MQLTTGASRPASEVWYGSQSLCPYGVSHGLLSAAQRKRDADVYRLRREEEDAMSFLSAFFVFAAPKFASLKELSYICSRKR